MPKSLSKKNRKPDLNQQLLQALALEKEGRTGEAERLYRVIIEVDADNCYATNRLAAIHSTRGENDEALRLIELSLKSNPTSPPASVDHSQILQRLGRFEESLAAAERALILSPNEFNALYLRGVALSRLDRHREATISFERALAMKPGHAHAHNLRGYSLEQLGYYPEAIEHYMRAQEADPEFAEAHLNEAFARLVQGDFERGWDKYEWRWQTDQASATSQFSQPYWDGQEPLAGKTLYVFAEQGFGDSIMFARYLPLLARQASSVIFGVHTPLKPLLSTLEGVFVVSEGDHVPAFDLQCPLVSLPGLLCTRLDTIPADVPYLHVPAEQRDVWRDRVPHDKALNVGLVWAGSRDFKKDKQRSIGLAGFVPLLAQSRCRFVSLHREVRPEDGEILSDHPEIIHFGEELRDFADTAAVIEQLDLVIGVDTSIVHIAGALGKPAWILLPFAPDFRWLLKRSDSPWYPSATLFRQPAPGDWTSVIAEVSTRLGTLA